MDNNNLNVMDEMYYSDLWIKLCKRSKDVVLTKDDIKNYNEESLKKGYINDIFKETSGVDRNYVIEMINEVSKVPEGDRFKNCNKLNGAYYDKLVENLNLQELVEKINVKYGLVIKRTEIRTFPTSDRVFKSEKGYDLDRFIETSIYAAEPLVIYAESKDNKWGFCKTYNYFGWIKMENVAIGDKEEVEKYCNCEDFIVITGKKVYLGYNPFMEALRGLQLDMGVKLEVETNWNREDLVFDMYSEGNYVVKYPLRESDGRLKFTHVLIPLSEDVHRGYLKCNRSNILRQIFKFQGERYGWGGEFNGRDCSSLIIDTFRSFGIKFQRNSGNQLNNSVGKKVIINGETSYHKRIKILENLKPGSLIFLKGHVVMYIGTFSDSMYIIHDTYGVFVNKKTEDNDNSDHKNENSIEEENQKEKIYLSIKGVTVSEIKEIYTSSGNPYIEEIVGIVDIFS